MINIFISSSEGGLTWPERLGISSGKPSTPPLPAPIVRDDAFLGTVEPPVGSLGRICFYFFCWGGKCSTPKAITNKMMAVKHGPFSRVDNKEFLVVFPFYFLRFQSSHTAAVFGSEIHLLLSTSPPPSAPKTPQYLVILVILHLSWFVRDRFPPL